MTSESKGGLKRGTPKVRYYPKWGTPQLTIQAMAFK